MALATRCPHCHTTFRVVHDQLKLRAGLVRCGACKEVFNGVENLLPPPEAAPAEGVPAPVEGVAAPAAAPALPLPAASAGETGAPPDTVTAVSAPDQVADEVAQDSAAATAPAAVETGDAPAAPDPLLRMTLMDFSASGTAAPAAAPEGDDGLEQAIDDLQRKPWRGTRPADAGPEEDALDALDGEEPEFVRRARRARQLRRRNRLWLGGGCIVLSLLLAAQALFMFRNQVAAWLPPAKPLLSGLCRMAGCDLGLPAQIDAVAIESSELQAVPDQPGRFMLSLLLRNRGSQAQAWPALELTLTDDNDQPLARRVLQPQEYLPASFDPEPGFPGNSEQAARLRFGVTDIKASGYRLYLFYP